MPAAAPRGRGSPEATRISFLLAVIPGRASGTCPQAFGRCTATPSLRPAAGSRIGCSIHRGALHGARPG